MVYEINKFKNLNMIFIKMNWKIVKELKKSCDMLNIFMIFFLKSGLLCFYESVNSFFDL